MIIDLGQDLCDSGSEYEPVSDELAKEITDTMNNSIHEAVALCCLVDQSDVEYALNCLTTIRTNLDAVTEKLEALKKQP